MPHRRRRANGSSGHSQRRFSPAEVLPQNRSSARARSRSAHADEFDSLRYRHSPFLGPGAPFQQRHPAQSVSGNATALKAFIHNNSHLASRCRTLKWQTTSLKQKLEELVASVEELQPEQSAMDWTASAGTVIYMPVNVTQDNEAPRVSPAHPEVEVLKKSTSPGSSQYSNKTENCFASRKATNSSGYSGFGQTPPQGQTGQTDGESSHYNNKTEKCFGFGKPRNVTGYTGFGSMQPQGQPGQTGWESSQYNNKPGNFGSRYATNPPGHTGLGQTQPQAQPGQTNWTSPSQSRGFVPFGGQAGTSTNMDSSRTARRRPDPSARPTPQSSGPRHAYVEDDISEEPGTGGM